MAGEVGTDTALKIAGWIVGGVAYGATLIAMVKHQLKQDREDINSLKARATVLESEMARGVRPQDITQINQRLDMIMQHLLEQKKQQH